MKKTVFIIALAACAAILTPSCNNAAKAPAATGTDSLAVAGSIVYFNLDQVVDGYDMANDLRSVVETKVQGIQAEIDRRGSKLQKDFNAFQQKIDKGLLTRSVAEAQSQKLQEQQNAYQTYALQKQQEMAEEQQVMLNQIMDAINGYVVKYNAEKHYALILTTTGDVLPAPVVTGDPSLDITEELLLGLNEEYVKSKADKK